MRRQISRKAVSESQHAYVIQAISFDLAERGDIKHDLFAADTILPATVNSGTGLGDESTKPKKLPLCPTDRGKLELARLVQQYGCGSV